MRLEPRRPVEGKLRAGLEDRRHPPRRAALHHPGVTAMRGGQCLDHRRTLAEPPDADQDAFVSPLHHAIPRTGAGPEARLPPSADPEHSQLSRALSTGPLEPPLVLPFAHRAVHEAELLVNCRCTGQAPLEYRTSDRQAGGPAIEHFPDPPDTVDRSGNEYRASARGGADLPREFGRIAPEPVGEQIKPIHPILIEKHSGTCHDRSDGTLEPARMAFHPPGKGKVADAAPGEDRHHQLRPGASHEYIHTEIERRPRRGRLAIRVKTDNLEIDGGSRRPRLLGDQAQFVMREADILEPDMPDAGSE